MEKLYTVAKTKPGADCGSDHELLFAKIKVKLEKIGKTTRPFRYDLNQIPYYNTVSSVQFSCSVVSDLCNTMNCSTTGLPVHQQLPEFTQTHVQSW